MDAPVRVLLRGGRTLDALVAAAELSEEAVALLADAADARGYVEALIENELYTDAIALLAHALPRREGVWWAWLCARVAAGDPPPQTVMASLDATRAWIAEPTDQRRRAAFEIAEATGLATPSGCAALAVFLTGDTLGPPTAPPAPPGEFAPAKAITGSVNLAVVEAKPDDVAGGYRDFLKQGLELADRTRLWTPDDAPTEPAR
jgi:hypothetical protein